MTYVLYSFVQILNIIGIKLKKDSKIITIFILALIWCFFAGNTGSADVGNYTTYYNNVASDNYKPTFEFGYLFLQKVAISYGLNYMQFKMLVIIPCILLIHSTIKKYSSNCHYVYFFYMLYAMFFDIVQIRNFMSISIVIFAIRFLIEGGMKNKIKYIIFVSLAISLHTVSVFYLILLFIRKNKSNRFTKTVIFITFILCVLAFINGNNIPMVGSIAQSIDNEKISGYLESKTRYGFIYPFCLQFFNFIMIFWTRKILNNSKKERNDLELNYQENAINDNIKVEDTSTSFVDFIFWINFISFIFFPLYMLNTTFYRLMRNYTILNLIAYSLAQKEIGKKHIERLVFSFFVLLNTCAWFYYDIVILDNVLRVLQPIFKINLFLG